MLNSLGNKNGPIRSQSDPQATEPYPNRKIWLIPSLPVGGNQLFKLSPLWKYIGVFFRLMSWEVPVEPRNRDALKMFWKTHASKMMGLEKMTPALNMAIFGNYFRFLGCKVEWKHHLHLVFGPTLDVYNKPTVSTRFPSPPCFHRPRFTQRCPPCPLLGEAVVLGNVFFWIRPRSYRRGRGFGDGDGFFQSLGHGKGWVLIKSNSVGFYIPGTPNNHL